MKRTREPMTKKKTVVTIVVAGLFLWAFLALSSAMSHHSEQAASVTGSITTIVATDPGTVRVDYTLVNSSADSVKVTCFLNVSNASGSYTGNNGSEFTLEGNASKYYSMDVPVGHDGAGYITDGTVTCS
jgi:hypothetical protein